MVQLIFIAGLLLLLMLHRVILSLYSNTNIDIFNDLLELSDLTLPELFLVTCIEETTKVKTIAGAHSD